MNVRIGTGAGYSGSRIEPALDIAERGNVKYLVFECLGERTVAIAQQLKRKNPRQGYDPYLDWRMPRVLAACLPRGIRIISNMGAANPRRAGERIREMLNDIDCRNARVAVITGDDVLETLFARDAHLAGSNLRLRDIQTKVVAANAYVGAERIVEALDLGAQVVVGGRFADPTLYLAPLCYEFGWSMTDWQHLGAGSVVGHLLECSAQVTGGFFADPGYQDVPNLADVGFPIAEVEPSGDAIVTKAPMTGGTVTVATCTAQLLYEVGDPSAYKTPDVVVDFTGVSLSQVGPEQVRVEGARGYEAPETLKVSVGYLDGFIGEGQISYGGYGAVKRARLAAEILAHRFDVIGLGLREVRFDLIGVNSLYGDADATVDPTEVRLRVAARTDTLADAEEIGHEVEALYATGPAAGGGVTRSAREVLAIGDAFIPREDVKLELEMLS